MMRITGNDPVNHGLANVHRFSGSGGDSQMVVYPIIGYGRTVLYSSRLQHLAAASEQRTCGQISSVHQQEMYVVYGHLLYE